MNYSNEHAYIGLTDDVLDLDKAFTFINSDDSGGNSLFVGTVRGYEEDQRRCRLPIRGLIYEAYETMALLKIIKIVEKVMKENEQLKRCYVVHKLGMVKTGEASILIATCSRGREACSKGCSLILNMIKKEVPIWKKIVYCDDDLNLTDEYKKDGLERKKISKSADISNGQIQTNWMLKSEAFWLKK